MSIGAAKTVFSGCMVQTVGSAILNCNRLDAPAPVKKQRRMVMADRKRCCCNCGRNIRHEVAPYGIECYCEIDGHYIGYIECFEGWCRRWKKSHTFDGMEELEGE